MSAKEGSQRTQPEFFDALERVLQREHPDCAALLAVERLSGGASMETYRLTAKDSADQEFTLCMRRGAGGVNREAEHSSGLEVEAMAMQAARAAGVAEPEVLYVLQPADGVGVGFLMEWLDGETLGARIVRSPELEAIRLKLAFQCGQELARIHAIDLNATGLAEVLRRVSPAEYLQETWQRYRDYPTPQPMIDFAARWLSENLPAVSPDSYTLVHNDFRNGNLMVDSENGVIAVLDWESVHIGDPMRDLGWICTNSWRFGRRDLAVGGFGSYADLFAGYEQISGKKVDPEHVRFWETFGSFWWAVGCLSMAEHYRTGPDSTVERPAIGRRSSECQVDCVNLLIPGPVELLPSAQAEIARFWESRQSRQPTDAGLEEPTAVETESGDMPTLDELLRSVRDFLHGEVMAATSGRTNFFARVAGNSLETVRRELRIAPELRQQELVALSTLLGEEQELAYGTASPGEAQTLVTKLRWELVNRLRAGSMDLNEPGLAEYLRMTVTHQVVIDQPQYSGLQHIIGPAGT